MEEGSFFLLSLFILQGEVLRPGTLGHGMIQKRFIGRKPSKWINRNDLKKKKKIGEGLGGRSAWHGMALAVATGDFSLYLSLCPKTFPTPRAWERSDGEVNIVLKKKRQVKLGLLSTGR